MEESRKKRYYSIGEVSEMLGLKAHILRFWESEFPMLRPRKNRAGNRAYTERDIKILTLIRHLLYEEKYTIEGAVKRMKDDREFFNQQLSLPLDEMPTGNAVQDIRRDLIRLREKISAL